MIAEATLSAKLSIALHPIAAVIVRLEAVNQRPLIVEVKLLRTWVSGVALYS